MPRAKSLEYYVELLAANERERLLNARRIRKEIRGSKKELDLGRAVLGITGSEEELQKYQKLATKVEQQSGQPIIVENFHAGEPARRQSAKAGIITDKLLVAARFDERPIEKGSSGSVILGVPVQPFVSYSGGQMWYDSRAEFPLPANTLRVAHFTIREWDNLTFDPEKDFGSHINTDSVLVGRDEIYASPNFSAGIGSVLRALEQRAEAVAV